MTHQFKKNALFKAIIGLMSLTAFNMAYAEVESAQSDAAETAEQQSASEQTTAQQALTTVQADQDQAEQDTAETTQTTTINTVKAKNSNLTPANSEKAQQFYQQYYLSPAEVIASDRNDVHPDRLCSGVWVTPIGNNVEAPSDPTQATATIGAETAYYDPNGTSVLEGDVQIDQQGRSIRADRVEIDPTQTYAKAQGEVQMAQGGLFAQSDEINYNLKTQQGDLKDSYYISEEQQAHGYASDIRRTAPDIVTLENASYSTCAPSTSPAWHIQAKSIELNQTTGRGVTKDARLYIKNTPIVPVPYFNFPIDDRRTTGFLVPSFGYTNDGGVQLSVPYYLNLAPNYDLTVTPRYLNERGFMAEGEFNYLTENYGAGKIWGGYLPGDNSYDNQDRKELHWQHFWKINNQWSTAVDYNYVSDEDYFSDLGNSLNSEDETYQERTWVLNYANGIPGITAQLKVQDFQTLDESLEDVEKPYAKLPQLIFHYEGGNYDGLEYGFYNDTAYFKKSIDDGSALESSGTRIYNQLYSRYNYRTPSLFVIPEVSVRSINTYFDRDSKVSQGYSEDESVEKSVAVPQFTLDTGMTFEKQGKFLQTISPRLFYAYAPYQQQDGYPNFDSTYASISYDRLFSPYRFYGHDRLEDNNFASLGVTYRLYDQVGLERLRASIGQSFYFADRKVRLDTDNDPIATDDYSGPVMTFSSQLSNTINVNSNVAFDADGKNTLSNLTLSYADDVGQLYNLGYIYRDELADLRQQAYQQVVGSFVQPIHNNWRLMGHVQYDIDNDLTREILLGVNYESCCWGVSVYARRYYNDLDDPTDEDVSAKKAIMAEFSLKGLGGLTGKLASLLEDRVIGFDHVNQTWTQR